jgi:hypothetical protein
MLPGVNTPQTIQLYLPDGDPQGLASTRAAGSDVTVFRVPRRFLRDHELGAMAARNGVYFLVRDAHTLIGHSSNVGAAIVDHDVDHLAWQTAYFAVSAGNVWTRDMTAHLSASSALVAKAAGKWSVDTASTHTTVAPTSEAAAEVQSEVEAIALLLGCLGCDVLDAPKRGEEPEKAKRRTPVFHGIKLSELIDAGLVAVGDTLASARAGYSATASVGTEGTVIYNGTRYPTPSAAGAAARQGQATNGWDFWAVQGHSGSHRLSAIRKQYQDSFADPSGNLGPEEQQRAD